MQILEVYAKNEKDAIEVAADLLEERADRIEVEVIRKGGAGFLGFGGRGPNRYGLGVVPGKTSLNVVIKSVIYSLLSKMGFRVRFLKIEEVEDGKLLVEIASQGAGYIIGKHGKTLEAIQFLVNLITEKATGSQPKVLLDIEHYRERRSRQLSDMAIKTAEAVIKSGKSRLLEPLNPYERRLVHMALQEDSRIETASEGNGVYKRIRIRKVGNAASGLTETADAETDEDESGFPEDAGHEEPED